MSAEPMPVGLPSCIGQRGHDWKANVCFRCGISRKKGRRRAAPPEEPGANGEAAVSTLQLLAPVAPEIAWPVRGQRWLRAIVVLVLRDGNACRWCRVEFSLDTLPTLDHLTPRSLGGTDAWSNLVLACRPCNQERGSTPVPEWLDRLARTLDSGEPPATAGA